MIDILRLDAVKRFLKLKNWRSDTAKNLLVYNGPNDDNNRPIRLVLPTNEEFEDTPVMVSKALKLLSEIEGCSIHTMSETIMNLSCDFLRQRIVTPSNIPTIPLKMANRVLANLTDLVYYSACLEEDAQPFFGKRRRIGKKFLDRCRFGQTFVGSFGLVLEMPISPSSSNNLTQAPFERRIMMRIARGMLATQKAIQEADVEILTSDYKQGFNANLYETMLKLMQSMQDFQTEFSFSWSPEYVLSPELQAMPKLRFTSASALPFLESAAKSLRRSSESQDTVITGKIVQLRSDNGEEEFDELDAATNGGRMIVIEWETEKGRSALIRAILSPEEYKQACDAHRDGKTISIAGKPEKPGKYFILTSPTDFKVES